MRAPSRPTGAEEEAAAAAERRRCSRQGGLRLGRLRRLPHLHRRGHERTVGPNLDESSVDFAAAEEQIRAGGGGMPAFEGQLSDEEIANVAAYVVETRLS